MNVPKLRFKEFNDEWKNVCLKNISIITMGQSPNSNNYTSNPEDTLLIQGNADLKNGVVIPRLYTKQITKVCDINDIIMTVRAPVGDIAVTKYNACIGRGVCSIKGSKYIYHYLDYLKNKDYWKKISKGSTIDSITSDDIKNLNIKLPSEKELNKISNFMDLINKKIELQSKKIEVLKLFKLFLREKLFYMFPTDNKKLSEILIKWNKKNKDNKYSYVESVNNKFGFIAQNEQFEDRNVASNDTSNYYVIEKGVFAYNPSRLNVGSLALKQNDKVSLVSPLYECFTTNQNQNFMLEWFQSKEFRRGTFSKYEGGVRNTLNFNNLSSIEIKLPSLESQNEIVKVLSCYNKMIDLESEKLKKLREFKKGLMQQLFI